MCNGTKTIGKKRNRRIGGGGDKYSLAKCSPRIGPRPVNLEYANDVVVVDNK